MSCFLWNYIFLRIYGFNRGVCFCYPRVSHSQLHTNEVQCVLGPSQLQFHRDKAENVDNRIGKTTKKIHYTITVSKDAAQIGNYTGKCEQN